MEMEVTVAAGATTVRAAVPVTPLIDAVIVEVPGATPVATPAELTVAVDALELVHVAVEVTFAVELSL